LPMILEVSYTAKLLAVLVVRVTFGIFSINPGLVAASAWADRPLASAMTCHCALAAVAQDADALQALTDGGAVLAVLLRQPQAQRAVGHAQLEGVHRARVIEPTRGQVGRGFRCLLEPLVVVGSSLREQRLFVGIQRHRCRQAAHRRALHRRSRVGRHRSG